jgi:hypothetical protein
MVTVLPGSLFENGDAALVQFVADDGLMGSGLSLHFRKLFPTLTEECRDFFAVPRHRREQPVHLWSSGWYTVGYHPMVLTVATRESVDAPGDAAGIEKGFADLAQMVRSCSLRIPSIGIPRLGCVDAAAVSWESQQEMVRRHFAPFPDIAVHLYNWPLPRRSAMRRKTQGA